MVSFPGRLWHHNDRNRGINLYSISYRLTSLSFHVNRSCHSWDTAFSNFDPEVTGRVMLKVKTRVQHSIDSHPFGSMGIGHPMPDTTFSKFDLENSRSRSWVRGTLKVGATSRWLTSHLFHVNRPFHSWDTAFSKFDLENLRSRSNNHDVGQLQF